MKKSYRKSYKKVERQGKSLRSQLCGVFQNLGLPFIVSLCILVFYPLTRNANLVKELLWYAFLPLIAGACLFLADKSWRDFALRTCTRLGRRFKPLLLFLAVYFLWNLFQKERSVDSFWSAITLGRLASYIFTFFVLIFLLQKIKVRFFFMEFLAFASALCSCYMIAEYFGWDFLKWQTMDRPPGTFANPNFSADFLATVLPLVFFWEVMGKTAISQTFSKRRHLIQRKNFSLRTVPARSLLLLIAILMSQSRAGFVSLAGGAATAAGLLFFMRDKSLDVKKSQTDTRVTSSHRWFVLFSLSGILIIELFIGIVFWLAPEKLSHVFNATTVQLRLKLWEGCLMLIRERPWLGWGLGSFGIVSQKTSYLVEPIVGQKQAFHAHNWFLELLVEQGIFGAAVFTGFLGYLFLLFLKALRVSVSACERLLLVGIISGIAGLLSGMIFDVWLNWWEGGWIFWVLLGFGTAISIRTLSKKDGVSLFKKTPYSRSAMLFRMTGALLILLSVLLFISNIIIFRSEKMVWRFYYLIQGSQYEKAMEMKDRSKVRIIDAPSMQFWNAVGLYHAKKTTEAVSILKSLMEKYPLVSKYPMMMGYVLIQQKKTGEAEMQMKKACDLEPNGENAIKLGKFYVSLKRQEEATRIMESQLKKALYPPLLHVYLKLEKEQGRTKEARTFLSQLRENLPFLKRKSRGELARWEAELSTLMNDMGWAKKAYRLSLLYDPDNYQVWNDYGLVLKNLKYYERSEKAFVRSIALKTDNFIPVFNRLELALDRRDFVLAKDLIKNLKTLKIPPEAVKRMEEIEKNLPE
jgi:O-antigen ligase/tetratricopeptide (TPR) repeat protein